MGKETFRLRSRVYVAGPITLGDVEANVANAVAMGRTLLDLGYAPFVPHTSHYSEPLSTWEKQPDRYERYLSVDQSFIAVCDALLRLPGSSRGADREVAWAYYIGVPTFFDLAALQNGLPPTQSFEIAHP